MSWRCIAVTAGLIACRATTGAHAAEATCAGYPRVAIKAPPGYCVGRVADARDGLRMPRRLLEVAPGRFWITDLGSWEPGRGRLLELRPDAAPAERLRVLAKGLDRPHGLALGPDGRVYVGEAGVVWRTPVAEAIEREGLITGLPSDGAHPLKELAFAGADRLYINVGSASDVCRDEHQQLPVPCPETEGPRPRAAIYEARLAGPGLTLQSLRPYATGLRNSLGLVAMPGSGRLWQAENSVDYPDADLPAEELNELSAGADYGWPYCVSDTRGRSVATRGYEGRVQCAQHHAAAQAWPAHAAPLQLRAVPQAAPGQAALPWSGRLVALWHGWRDNGHRVAAWRLGADGRPRGPRETLLGPWPGGAPTGATVDHLGRLWVVEDRNRTVLIVAPDVR